MPTPIKVVLVIPTLDRSGAEKQLTMLASGLPRDEFEVEVVALTRGGPFADELNRQNIPLTILYKRGKFDLRALRALRQIFRDRQPDIVHTWLFAANAYGRWAAGKGPTPKVIVSERCVDIWKSRWQLWIDRRQFSRTDRLVGNSQSVADYYRQLGFPAEKLSVIPNGITSPPAPDPSLRAVVLSELGFAADHRVIAYVGRLAPQKRLQDLIWSFELLRQIVPSLKFLIVGDGPERADLEQYARNLRCDSDIRFLGHRDDVSRLLSTVDIFWLASDYEGQSNSVMEAMSAGIPVIVSDIPPNRELVTDRETGFVVPVGNTSAFVQAAQEILNDRALAQRLGAAARSQMQTNFSVTKMVDAYADLYRNLSRQSPLTRRNP
ncbi:MAG: glycosyltransferase family 4 protein [Planctomycetaceae bacterium]